jgi:4-amino-4-deoxy-L-arabinose transferase-like glycosyltransferase
MCQVLLVIGAGILVRLVLVAAGGQPERFEYDAIARNLIAGRGYVYDQLGTPYRSFYAGLGYIGLNTATDWLFPTHPAAMLVTQSLYAGVLALLVFLIAARLCDSRLAVVAAALALFHPALVYYDTRKLHPLGFDSLVMVATVWWLMRLRDDRRLIVAGITGLVLGLAILQRGSMGLFFVASLCWLVVFVGRDRTGAALVAVYAAGMSVAVLPWVARNYAIHGMVMIESMAPQQFWKGNASYSNGSGYLPSGRNVYDAAPTRLVREWEHRDETGQFQLFRAEGLAEVRADPHRAAGLMLRKFLYFWTAPPSSGQAYPSRYFDAYLAYYVVILFLAVVGGVTASGRPALRPDIWLCALFFASLSVVHALMFVEMRHRWAAEPLMLAFVPLGAQAIAQFVRGRPFSDPDGGDVTRPSEK